MPVQWLKTQYPNVRYYEHGSRRTRNGQPDKYFAIRYYVNGRRKEEGIGWATEGWNAEKAHSLLGEIRAAIRTGKGPQSLAERREKEAEAKATKEAEKLQKQQAEMTLEDFFRTVYIPRAQKEKRSWRTDEQRIAKAINPALGKLPLRAMRREDVQAFLDQLTEKGNAPVTVKQYMGIIRRAFYIAADTTLANDMPLVTGKNPATGLRLPSVHNERERYLTAPEVEAVLKAAGNLHSPDLQDCIILSLNTGLRLGELTRLRWLDVDWISKIVAVPHEDKRKPGGKVPLNGDALAVLRRRKETHDPKHGELVFPSPAGGRERKTLSHLFRHIVDEAGLNNGITDPRHRIVFHSLRHTFAFWLAIAGTDLYRIMKLMRHSSITMTMRYAHLLPDATRNAVHTLRAPQDDA